MTTLIPFDLEAAKRGEPVITRDGRPARIVCFDMNGTEGNIVALITDDDGNESESVHYDDGVWLPGSETNCDLFMAPKPKRKVMMPECWVHKYAEVDYGTEATFVSPMPNRLDDWHHIPAHEVEIEG